MITITAPEKNSLFTTITPLNFDKDFPEWGVMWERDEDRLSFDNPLVKIPGGNFYAAISEPGVTTISFKMVTNNLDLKLLDKTMAKIANVCVYPDGTSRPILVSKNYDPEWSRKARLTKISSEVGTKFNYINLEFSLISNLWYGPVVIKSWDGPADLHQNQQHQVTFNLNHAPTDFVLFIQGEVKTVILITSEDNGNQSEFYKHTNVNGYFLLETETNTIMVQGVEQMSDLPPNFKLKKGLIISGEGTYDLMMLKYRETKL